MITTTQPAVIMTMDELNDIIRRTAQAAAREVINTMPSTAGQDDLWDAKQAGEYLGVAPDTITYNWSKNTGFPAAIELGGGVRVKSRWKASEIKAWAEKQKPKKAA